MSGDEWRRLYCYPRDAQPPVVTTAAEAVRQLDGLRSDPEEVHLDADAIVREYLKATSPEVAAAYERADDRCGGWWYS